MTQGWDSFAGRLVDSVVVRSPLPDPLIRVVQWIFQKPGWVMAGGIVLCAIVGLAVLAVAWRRRAIWTWLVTRERGVKPAMAGAVGTLLVLMIGMGVKASDFMTHDNDFCSGCQIFVPSVPEFVHPDTGTYHLVDQQEGNPDALTCQSCSTFELQNQTKTPLAGMLARPSQVPPHAKMPSDITCHARTAHRFQPGDTTCARQGFHLTDSTRFRLTSSREPPRGLSVPGRGRGQGAAPPEDASPERRTDGSVSPSDTFPHERHSRLACLTCHDLRSEGRRLTFEAPGGCQVCHHQRPAQAKCASCHHAGDLAATLPVQVAVAVPRHDRRRRTVQFPHAKHDTLACTGCHVTPVTLAPADSVRTCAGCHAEHHAESRDCAACHQTAATAAPHQRPIQAHVACGACHNPATVARLVPTRSFCLACHTPQQDHYQPKECSTCHFQRTPAELQRKLGRGGARS